MSKITPIRGVINRLVAVLIAIIAYQGAEMLFILPTRAHFPHADLSSLLIMLLAFTILFWWLHRTYRRMLSGATIDQGGWRVDWRNWRKLLWGLAFGVIILLLVQLTGALLISSHVVEQSANETALNSLIGQNKITMTLFVTMIAPIVEEYIFRGLIMNLIPQPQSLLQQGFSITMSVCAFAVVHGPTNWIDFCLYAGLGLGLSVTYRMTRDLKCAMLLHVTNNVLATFI